jgi:hypothetical protein
LTAGQIYEFAKKCKDKSTKGFINFIFKQTKGAIPKNDIRYAIKHGGLVRTPTVIKRTEIETSAKRFYGFEARLAKKAENRLNGLNRQLTTEHGSAASRRPQRGWVLTPIDAGF